MKKPHPDKSISPKAFYDIIIEALKNSAFQQRYSSTQFEIELNGYDVQNEISLENQIVFEGLHYSNIKILIRNCILKGRYIFKSVNFFSVDFIESEIDVLQFSDSSLQVFSYVLSNGLALAMSNVKFKQHFDIRMATIQNSISIDNVSVKSSISITDVNTRNLSLHGNSGSFDLQNGNFYEVRIAKNKFDNVKIFSFNNKRLSIESPLFIECDEANSINKLVLGPNFDNEAVINSGNQFVNINEIELYDSVLTKKITFNQINANAFRFIQIRNMGILNLYDINISGDKSEFQIRRSFLASTTIINCDFEKIHKFIFEGSDIKDISYNNVSWPDKFVDENINDKEKYHKRKTELYKQLKHGAIKNSDTLNAVRFYSIEKRSYYKLLKWNWRDISTKSIFWLNGRSNNYNQSWTQPIILNVLIQAVIYFLLLIRLMNLNTIDYLALSSSSHPFTLFLSILNKSYPLLGFFNMLNPAFRVDEIDVRINDSNLAISLVTVSRVISAYLIFQTISAFRRHN